MNKFKLLTKADYILVLMILTFSLIGIAGIRNRNRNRTAYIYYHNCLIGAYSLNHSQIIKINENCEAEVKDGKIRMLRSDCPDKRCIHQGLSDTMPIICLPNQIVIDIKTDSQKRQVHILY